MELLGHNSLLMLEKSMDFLWTKQAAILDNISNAETPNYKTKVVTFEESLREKRSARVRRALRCARCWKARSSLSLRRRKRPAWMKTESIWSNRALSWRATPISSSTFTARFQVICRRCVQRFADSKPLAERGKNKWHF